MNNIDEAFKKIDRADFLPGSAKTDKDIDAPISIGHGQTNSQPTTVRMMLNWLDPQAGEKILDVGSGSGWTTALLAYLAGPGGKVYAVERVPELVKFGADNCKRSRIENAEFFQAGERYGLPDFAPYDRILVSAAAKQLPEELPEQLKTGGKMVIPIRSSIFVITKADKHNYTSTEHYGFRFVPLI
jgi:protein-L-isoaspartate(D-aspartate) O-methyltransferase